MKTKKEILNWWIECGKNTENINDYRNDYKDFWEKINKNEVVIIEKVKGEGEKQWHSITLMKQAWKYSLRLLFTNLECIKISGF
jgi:hypothetical protein